MLDSVLEFYFPVPVRIAFACCSVASNILIGVFTPCDHKHVVWLSHIAFCCGYAMLRIRRGLMYFCCCHNVYMPCTQGYKSINMASASSDIATCKVMLLNVGSQELPVKLNITIDLDEKLSEHIRFAEEFVNKIFCGGYYKTSPKFEISTIDESTGERVVWKEHLTAKQCWGAKPNRQYYVCSRVLPDMDDTKGQAR